MSLLELSFSNIVRDRDDDDPNEAMVVNTPPVTADEWEVHAIGKTVAEDNAEYSEDAAVVVAAFRDERKDHLPEWTDRDDPYPLTALNEAGVTYYSFPASFQAIDPYLNAPTPDVVNEAFENAGLA